MQQAVTVFPAATPLCGEMSLPGDKSITHRALILSAISDVKVSIQNGSSGLDCAATRGALEQMGVPIHIDRQQWTVQGVGLRGLKAPQTEIDCGNSGTTMRLLCGLLAAQSFDSVLVGDASLNQRPMARVAEPLNAMGAKIQLSKTNTAPVVISGGQTLNGYSGVLKVNSSQVKSALQLAGLYAKGPVSVDTPLPCRDHTERMFALFDQSHAYPLCIDVPGDFSAASFWMVAATLIPGSKLCLKQVNLNPTRIGLFKSLKQMGASMSLRHVTYLSGEWRGDIIVRASKLKGIYIPEEWVPLMIDEFPILAVAASMAAGQTVFRGAQELRKKESDRLSTMYTALKKLGIKVEMFEDGLCIEGSSEVQGGTVSSAGDHRVAMSMFIIGTCAKAPVKVNDVDCVATSFPGFFQLAKQLGLKMTLSSGKND